MLQRNISLPNGPNLFITSSPLSIARPHRVRVGGAGSQRPPPARAGAAAASMSGGIVALAAQGTFVLISVLQARAAMRGPLGAALRGSGIGLALGAGYMTAGMAGAVSDHNRAVRIASAAGGGFSETMLQREV